MWRREFASPLTGLADVRLCAASIVDPVAVPFSRCSAYGGISTRHVQVWRPEHENVLSAKAHASRVVGQLNLRENAEPTSQIVVTGAQHYSFLAPFSLEVELDLADRINAGFQRVLTVAPFRHDLQTKSLTFLVRSFGGLPARALNGALQILWDASVTLRVGWLR